MVRTAQATRWAGRATAQAIGSLLSSVHRIWRAHQLQPHRLRTFKRSRDPRFARLADIVGLYVDPPAHAVVLSPDAKGQIQTDIPRIPVVVGRNIARSGVLGNCKRAPRLQKAVESAG